MQFSTALGANDPPIAITQGRPSICQCMRRVCYGGCSCGSCRWSRGSWGPPCGCILIRLQVTIGCLRSPGTRSLVSAGRSTGGRTAARAAAARGRFDLPLSAANRPAAGAPFLSTMGIRTLAAVLLLAALGGAAALQQGAPPLQVGVQAFWLPHSCWSRLCRALETARAACVGQDCFVMGGAQAKASPTRVLLQAAAVQRGSSLVITGLRCAAGCAVPRPCSPGIPARRVALLRRVALPRRAGEIGAVADGCTCSCQVKAQPCSPVCRVEGAVRAWYTPGECAGRRPSECG